MPSGIRATKTIIEPIKGIMLKKRNAPDLSTSCNLRIAAVNKGIIEIIITPTIIQNTASIIAEPSAAGLKSNNKK